MKYLVTWKVEKTIPTECPDYKPDPYTGEYPLIHCLVYHCKTVIENKLAEFSTEQECQDFIKKAPSNCRDMVYVLLER